MEKKNKIVGFSLLFLMLILGCSKDGENSGNSNVPIDKSANLLAIGASANDFLANGKYDKLLIEIAYVTGFRPTEEALVGFEEFLRARTFKEDIEFVYSALSSPMEENLTIKEVYTMERTNRSQYTQGSTLSMYVYFADAPSESDVASQDKVTLGAVYRNTSMVLYESTIRDLASKSDMVSVSDMETSTLNHEFGHLLGLVNLGTPPVHPEHEDIKTADDGTQTGNNHCNEPECLMRAELQFGSSLLKAVQSYRSKGLVALPQLGEECLLDLRGNGGR